ncbi:MAG: hypothetical protein DMF63_10735 [Acidobacteria bacterium]|nr:MAG: hypothetical protein DMF63_10735 [Acidobacteriota bacterium]
MNLLKVFSISILLLALGIQTNSQGTNEAVLVDEYDSTPCDDFLGRLDFFLGEMRLHPDSKGLIVISNPAEERADGVMLQWMMEYQFEFRAFDSSRIEIVRADGDKFHHEFWRIPPGAATPKIENSGFGYRMSDTVTKPFMLANETKFGTQICPEIDDQRLFVEFLKANPSARGNIVVRDDSDENARKKARSILWKFKTKYGISRKRLRTFTARLTQPASNDEPIVEYWYLPARN